MLRSICPATLLALLTLFVPSLFAEDDKTEWGNLTATFLYDGEPPEPRVITVDKDVAALKLPIFDQSLVVDSKTKGIANVVVWLYQAPNSKLPPIHPSYAEPAKRDVILNCRNGEFDPHISLLTTDQKLVVNNPDKIGYSLKGDFFKNGSLSDLIPAGGSIPRNFSKREAVPAPIACAIHSWMSAYILVKDHPYAANSNAEGKLEIRNLPVGEHTFNFWHERRGFIVNTKHNDKPETWKLGRLTVNIKPGDNDLGEIKFKP